jgi:alkyl hydroperoxide reductase subunit AhpC
VLKAMRHLQEHPQEVCPVDWYPGQPAIVQPG